MTLRLAQRRQAAVFLLATVTIVLLGAHVDAAEEPSFEYPAWYPSWAPRLLGAQFTLVGQSLLPFPSPISEDDRLGRTKYGFGINVEQPLADDGNTGLFARAGWSDGRTESFAFTEVDRHLSVGIQVSGVRWSRPDDRFGAGYAVHWRSPEPRDDLAGGGQGFMLGDGRLNYGTERIFEMYYRVQVFRYAQVGPDFQYIANPGYSRDRGPGFVLGGRLRVAY